MRRSALPDFGADRPIRVREAGVRDALLQDARVRDARAVDVRVRSIPDHDIPDLARVALAAAALVAMWNLRWFVDLTDRNLLIAQADGSPLTQAVLLGLGGAMAASIAWLGADRLRPLARWPVLAFVGWLSVTTLLSVEPALSIRRMGVLCVAATLACGVLVLPRSGRQFAQALLIAAGIVLGASYLGIAFLPELAVHNAYDLGADPAHAGLWRGIFDGKNSAGAAMLVAVFAGLYIAAALDRCAGWTVAAAAVVFLMGSHSKTVLATLPVVVLAVAAFERAGRRWQRRMVLLGPILLMVAVSIGSVLLPPVRAALDAVMSDASFTGRAEIWDFSLASIAQRPVQGYGFGAFWGTSRTLYASDTDAWAPAAAHAHNGFLDAALAMGVPGLALLVAVYAALPLRDMIALAERDGGLDAMTRLFIRCWMFGMLSASFEPIFLNTRGAMCYVMFLAIFGLRLRASYRPLR